MASSTLVTSLLAVCRSSLSMRYQLVGSASVDFQLAYMACVVIGQVCIATMASLRKSVPRPLPFGSYQRVWAI